MYFGFMDDVMFSYLGTNGRIDKIRLQSRLKSLTLPKPPIPNVISRQLQCMVRFFTMQHQGQSLLSVLNAAELTSQADAIIALHLLQ